MKNWTVKKRIVCGFAAILTLLGILAVSSVTLLHKVETNIHVVLVDALPGTTIASKIKFNTSEGHLAVWRHVIGRTPEEKKSQVEILQQTIAGNDKLMANYEKTITTDEDRQNFEKVRLTREEYGKCRQKMLDLSSAGRPLDELMEYNKTTLHAAHSAMNEALDTLFTWNENQGNRSGDASQNALTQAKSIIVGSSVAGIVLGVALATIIIVGLGKVLRRVADSLGEGSDQVAAAASQVAAASQSLAEGVSEQAASLEETGASLEEMSSMTRRNADNARHAKELSNQTRAAAETGASDMDQMSAAMNAIKTSSDNIAKIIKTIDEIAFQTNILALNAAVEAARAGEAGMGFAVVADEVRNLAQRSATAARETADKIEDSIKKSEHGVQISGKVSGSLAEIVTKARQMDSLVAEIAGASQEQSQGISQVNTAVVQMDKVTQSSAAGAEESASAAEELNAQAESLREGVAQLLALVGGKSDSGQNATASSPKAPAAHPEPKLKEAAAHSTKSSAPSHNGNGNGNGNGHSQPHSTPTTTLLHAGSRSSGDIPMEGDFKDF